MPVILVFLLGLGLRLYGLGLKPLWIDETYTLERARLPLAALWTDLVSDHLPAYFAILWTTTRLIGESEWALRLPSALLSASVAVALPLLGRVLCRPSAGLLAGGLFALSPFVIFWSQEAKPEMMALAVTTWSTYLLLLAWRNGTARPWLWLLYGALSLLGLYTFYYDAFVFAAHNLAVAVACLRGRSWPTFGRWLAGQLVLVLLFVGWPLTHLVGHLAEAGFATSGPLSAIAFLTQFVVGPLGGGTADPNASLAASPATLVAGSLLSLLGLAGLVSIGRRTGWSFACLVLLAWWAVPLLLAFVVQLVVPARAAYYLLPVVPVVLLLASLALVELARQWRGRAVAASAALTLAIAGAWPALDAGQYAAAPTQHAGWRDAAVSFVAHRQPGELLVADPGWQASTLAYYLPDPAWVAPARPPSQPLSCLLETARQGVPGVWVATTAYSSLPQTVAPVVQSLSGGPDATMSAGGVRLDHYTFPGSVAGNRGPSGWGDFIVDGGRGAARLGSPGALQTTTLCDADTPDVDVRTTVHSDRWPSAGNEFADLLVRWREPDTAYLVRLRFDATGRGWLQAGRWMSGAADLSGPEVALPGEPSTDRLPSYAVRGQVVGSRPTSLRLKAWPAEAAEPHDWATELTDSTPELQSPGAVGLQAYVSARAANTPVTIAFDDIELSAAHP